MMRSIVFCLIFCSCLNFAMGQLNTTYHSLALAKEDPVTVEYLVLQKKKLRKLPDSLDQFENLLGLDLSKNKIDLLGDEIGELTSLHELDLSKNEISVLPPQIGNLSNLRKLVLSRNTIKELPEEIGKMSSLKELVLDGNALTTLPKSIYQLSQLKILDIRQMDFEASEVEELSRQMPELRILHSTDCPCGF